MKEGRRAEEIFEVILRREGFGIQKTNEEEDRTYGFDFWLWADDPNHRVFVDITVQDDLAELAHKQRRAAARHVVLVRLRSLDLRRAVRNVTVADLAATLVVLAQTARALAEPERANREPLTLHLDLSSLSAEQQQDLLDLARCRLRTVLARDPALLERLWEEVGRRQVALHEAGLSWNLLARATGRDRKTVKRAVRQRQKGP